MRAVAAAARLAIGLSVVWLAAMEAGAQRIVSGPQSAPLVTVDVVDAARVESTPSVELPELERFTVEWARSQLTDRRPAATARKLESQALPFLPTSTLIELEPVWRRAGHNEWLFLGRGHHTLESLLERFGDDGTLRREADGSVLLRRPLYVAPTASLLLSEGAWLKMSVQDGVVLISSGEVAIVDARITAWDEESSSRSLRPESDKSKARLWASGVPRPYLLFQNGSRTWIANSRLEGLGYMGGYGSYGLSFSATLARSSLNRHLQKLPRPRGWLIGNTIEDLFFGVYSNRADGLVIVGNDFVRNLIYGIDPHDHSRGVVIARNVARDTVHSHGIIISRDVSRARIFENVSIGNGGSGIVLDRQSVGVRVEANRAIANAGDGLALFESGTASLRSNLAALNQRNGIYARNSERVGIVGNRIARNGDDGIEVMAQELKPGSRDFELDPYEARASARLEANRFEDNANSAVSAKGVDWLSLSSNVYVDSGPSYFAGDLKGVSGRILLEEPKESDRALVVRRSAGAGR